MKSNIYLTNTHKQVYILWFRLILVQVPNYGQNVIMEFIANHLQVQFKDYYTKMRCQRIPLCNCGNIDL